MTLKQSISPLHRYYVTDDTERVRRYWKSFQALNHSSWYIICIDLSIHSIFRNACGVRTPNGTGAKFGRKFIGLGKGPAIINEWCRTFKRWVTERAQCSLLGRRCCGWPGSSESFIEESLCLSARVRWHDHCFADSHSNNHLFWLL